MNKLSVAEMALGFMLMFARNLFIASNELKSGKWNKSAGFQVRVPAHRGFASDNLRPFFQRLHRPRLH